MQAKIAIIGGTGVYDPRMLEDVREETIATKYGQAVVKLGSYQGKNIAFLARHGAGHAVPPHRVNYRANIRALKELGVEKVIATAAVGSLNKDMKPGDFVLVDQFIDFTKNRVTTFFEGEEGVVHVDMTEPYCGQVRKVLIKAGEGLPVKTHNGGTYICAEGPRFETPAEIRMYRQLGGDLVGMTQCPEVVLARESELCYAAIAMVTNFAAGISPTLLTHAEVVETMNNNAENLKSLIMNTISLLTDERPCRCSEALRELGKFG